MKRESDEKWKIAQELLSLAILIPILFHFLKISDSLTTNVLLQIAGVGVAYGAMKMIGRGFKGG